MAKSTTATKVISPYGELMHVFISGEGREDLNGNPRYSACIRLHEDSKELKEFQEKIDEFWEEHKPAKIANYKSCGIKRETVPNPDDPETRKDTENYLIQFWTSTTFPDGSKKVIDIYNAKGKKVTSQMQDKFIGNGSMGWLSGAMDIYQANKKEAGVTLYLNAVQLKKFVEYTGSALLATPEDIEDDDFLGLDTDTDVELGESKLGI